MHPARTGQRMRKQGAALFIRYEIDLNFAILSHFEGLDGIGKNSNSALAVTGDGIPLGAARFEFSSPGAKFMQVSECDLVAAFQIEDFTGIVE